MKVINCQKERYRKDTQLLCILISFYASFTPNYLCIRSVLLVTALFIFFKSWPIGFVLMQNVILPMQKWSWKMNPRGIPIFTLQSDCNYWIAVIGYDLVALENLWATSHINLCIHVINFVISKSNCIIVKQHSIISDVKCFNQVISQCQLIIIGIFFFHNI